MSKYSRNYSIDGWPIIKDDRTLTFQEVFEELLALEQEKESKQAEIDSLMLEYCPSDMAQEQTDNWAAHQVPVEESK